MEKLRREETEEQALRYEVTLLEAVLNRDEIIEILSRLPEGEFTSVFESRSQPFQTSNGVVVEYLSFGVKEKTGCRLFRVFQRESLVLNLLVVSLSKPIFYKISFNEIDGGWVYSRVLRENANFDGDETRFTLNPVTDPNEIILTLVAAREVLEM